MTKETRLRWLERALRMEGLQNTSSGYTVGTDVMQEEAGTAKEKLDEHCQTRSEGYGHYLG